ncbi:hypothetical protein Tco_1091224 [Tanacetum coccineum]|uniref:Uncharacterized protein n=1 Tax=Tanacetum coccineum TaxID=301880 RepID=A0ABQ5I6K7_9ASTR
MTARISIQDKPSISLPPREGVERLLALTTPPPSLLTPLSSLLPQIPSPPLLASPPASVLPASPPASPIRPEGKDQSLLTTRNEVMFYQDLRNDIVESSSAVALDATRCPRADYGFCRQTHDLSDVETLVDEKVSYMTRSEIMGLRYVVMGQQAVISQLQAPDRRSQAMTSEMLQADHRRQAEIAVILNI